MTYGTIMYYVGMEHWKDAADLTDKYLREKGWYFMTHIRATLWVRNICYYLAYYIVMMNGTKKFSFMDVYFTAMPLTFVQGILIILQFFWLLLGNKWFAEGNLMLIIMWVYGIISSISADLLWANLDWYDYILGFRIWRYIILSFSIIFAMFYIG
jgi:hypothetical protein